MARKTKAQKEAEALEALEAEKAQNETTESSNEVSATDMASAEQSEVKSEVQASSDASGDGEQAVQDEVEAEKLATDELDKFEADEAEFSTENVDPTVTEDSPPVPKGGFEQVSTSGKVGSQETGQGTVTENPETVGVPISEVPIRLLPGFGEGSKRNPKDPQEVRFAREMLQKIRKLVG